MILNPSFLYFEEVFKIPSSKLKHNPLQNSHQNISNISGSTIKRALHRSGIMLGLLTISLSVPNFDAILDLIGATTITLLNIVFPPIFYLLLSKQYQSLHDDTSGDEVLSSSYVSISSDASGDHITESVSLPVKIYSWHLVIVGSIAGVIALVSSIQSISADFQTVEICWSLL